MQYKSGSERVNRHSYSSYKNPRIEWLGKIPEHWGVFPLGLHSELIVPMRDKPEDLLGDIPWIRIEDFDGKYISSSKSKQGVSIDTIKAMNLKVFPVGTVLCSCSCNMGKTAIASKPIISNQTFIGIYPDKHIASDYLYYLMGVCQEHLSVVATGAIQQYLSKNDFSRLRIPIPPILEQRSIADFLDRETSRIDALITKYQRLIELLEEKRTNLIDQALIKGVDETVEMKETNILWLGKIPKHWEAIQLKYILKESSAAIKPGPFGSQLLSSEMGNGDIKVYNQRNVINHDITIGENYITQEKYNELKAFTIQEGDVLITSRGTIGKCLVIPKDAPKGIIHPCLIRIIVNTNKITQEYLSYLLQDSSIIQNQLFLQSNATTIDVIYSENLKRVILALPPVEEQKKILGYLRGTTKGINVIIGKVKNIIDKLTEYRTSLIFSTVTGKIDIRN